MVIVMKKTSNQDERNAVVKKVKDLGLGVHISEGQDKYLLGLIGDTSRVLDGNIEVMSGVERIFRVEESYKLASRNFKAVDTVIDVNGQSVGGKEVVLIAGPCSVEGEEQIIETAKKVKKAGAQFLRGGAFKPRTSPYGFQGYGEEALRWLQVAKQETGLGIVSEVTSEELVEMAEKYIDIIQIGARNVQNFNLLRAVGRIDKPVLLKRGMSTTINEWLNSAEYIMSEGNQKVILCERGIRTFETATRNTLDISAVPVLKRLTHLPVLIDPSHAGGKSYFVDALAKAGIAAGADGLIIEVHQNPQEALSDASQQITPEQFGVLAKGIRKIADVVGRK